MHQIFLASQTNSVRVPKLNFLILFIKRISVKKVFYSGNFLLGKDFGNKQKVKACLVT